MKKIAKTPEPRISLKELAARLDTSVCTVSKALHNKPKVSAAMRAKVLALAEELGYAPNLAASSMARRPFRVAWIYPEAWPSYHLPLLQGGIHRAEVLRDFNLSVTPFQFHNFTKIDDCICAVKDAESAGFDAMVICPGSYEPDAQETITQIISGLNCPVIMLGWSELQRHSRICNVRQHSRLCGKMAGNLAQLLLSVSDAAGIIIGRMAIEDHANKINGFRSMLEEANLTFAGYAESFDVPEMAYGAVRALLNREPELKLLYVGTENIRGVMDYFAEHRLFGRIKLIGTGTSEEVNAGLRNGNIQFALDEKPFLLGETALDAVCRKLLLNQELPPTILVPPTPRLRCQLDDVVPNELDSAALPYPLEGIQNVYN